MPQDGQSGLRPAYGPGGPNGPVGGGPGGPNGAGGPGGPDDSGKDAGETSSLKADLNPTKIAAGAGAAIVTAILGSFLGAVGTIIGAALGSIISTLATTLFTRSIEVSKDKALELKDKATAKRGKGVAAGTADAARQSSGRPDAGPTGEETVLLDPSQAPAQPRASRSGSRFGGFRRIKLTRRTVIASVIMAAVTFGVSMFLITGAEVVKGSSLAGNGQSTTIGNAVRGQDAPAATDGNNDQDNKSGESSTSESSTSTSTSESSTSTSDSTGDSGESNSQNDGGSLGDQLNRVLPTQQPGSGSQSDQGGDSGSGSGSGSGSDSGSGQGGSGSGQQGGSGSGSGQNGNQGGGQGSSG